MIHEKAKEQAIRWSNNNEHSYAKNQGKLDQRTRNP